MAEQAGFQTLRLRRDGPILTVQLSREEKLNAFNAAMFAEVTAVAQGPARDPDVRVVVFTGTGRAFSSGADLSNMGGPRPDPSLNRTEAFKAGLMAAQKAFDEVELLPKPTIAAINGHVVGAGLQLALACDFRIAVRGIRLGLSDVKIGIIPGLGGTLRLPRLIGMARAKEIILLGDLIGPERALEIGLITSLVDPGELEDAVGKLAETLLSRAPLALAEAKQLLDREASLEAVAEAQARLFKTGDAREGITAFLEKRPARFKGS